MKNYERRLNALRAEQDSLHRQFNTKWDAVLEGMNAIGTAKTPEELRAIAARIEQNQQELEAAHPRLRADLEASFKETMAVFREMAAEAGVKMGAPR